MLLELVEVLRQVRLDAREAAEGRQEGLMVRGVVEEEVQVVGRAYRYSAVGDGVQAVGAVHGAVSSAGPAAGRGSGVPSTYEAWELIQESSTRAATR